VEYKDPELEEWEKFKKSMMEVNKVCTVTSNMHTLCFWGVFNLSTDYTVTEVLFNALLLIVFITIK